MTASRPAAPPTEIEIKFRLPEGAEAQLLAHPALRAVGGAAPKPRREVSTYFDTPNRDLARHGAVLRVRRRGRKRVQTLKLRGGVHGPFGRGEWEWPVMGDRPNLDLLAETPLPALLGAPAELHPVFTTDISRTSWTLEHDGAVIEVALDRGAVTAGAAREEIHELELELKSGPPAALYRLAVELHGGIPLLLGSESKSDRGWRLSTGQARRAEKQVDLPLPRDIGAAEACRRLLGATLGNVLANQPAAAAGEAEGVHQMRVAIRRLRAILALFRPHLEPHAAARFTTELRRLGRVLGEARDWDVFCGETLPAAEEDEVVAPWLAPLRSAAELQRDAAHRRLAEEFAAPALTAMVLGLAAWAEEPALLAGVAEEGELPGRLVALAPALAGRLERKVRRRGRRIRHRPTEELHALRKAMKKLRYGLEFLAPLLRPKQVKAYLRGCKALQELLGAINDAAVAVALAERLGGDRQAELAPALAALAGWAGRRHSEARAGLPSAWRGFKSLALPAPARR